MKLRPRPPRQAIAEFVAMKPNIRMTVREVVRGGGDIAVVYNDWRVKLTRPDGQAQEDSGKASEIVRRQKDGSWLFVVDAPRMRG